MRCASTVFRDTNSDAAASTLFSPRATARDTAEGGVPLGEGSAAEDQGAQDGVAEVQALGGRVDQTVLLGGPEGVQGEPGRLQRLAEGVGLPGTPGGEHDQRPAGRLREPVDPR